ncbi:MAG: GGDEF domain-containing protein [Henriciella sp.]|nr:GGDEF domain-containing protein [Hyphomonadaceae bacterium]
MKFGSDLCDAPTEREFATSMIMTSVVILIVALAIAVSVTWYTTKGYEAHIHQQAIRTSVILPLVIVPLCTAIVGYQGFANHRRMLAVSKLARTDDMTGLANRRAFMHAATQMFRDTDFEYSGLCLFIVDLDHFKQINDAHGHETGDVVLIHAAKQIELAAPEEALVARLGGEEFAVLMPYENITQLHQRAEAIRHQVAATPCEHQSISIRVSASVGVGIAHPRDTVSSVLSRADDALYEAKDKGRNRFVIAA